MLKETYEFHLENLQKGDYSEVMIKIGDFMNFLTYIE